MPLIIHVRPGKLVSFLGIGAGERFYHLGATQISFYILVKASWNETLYILWTVFDLKISLPSDLWQASEKFITQKSKSIAKRSNRHDILIRAIKTKKTDLLQRTELSMCRGKRFASQILWQRSKNSWLQTVSCSGMLMMWDQLETGSMALSASFQILAAHMEVTGNC